MKTFVIQLVNPSQGSADSGAGSLPIVELPQQRFGQAEPEVWWYGPFNNEGSIVVEGIGVGSSRYLMFVLAIEVRL